MALCALGSLTWMHSARDPQLNKEHLLSSNSVAFRSGELADGMQKLASLADGPVRASGNTLSLSINGTPRTLEISIRG